jgi:hypothetical protein
VRELTEPKKHRFPKDKDKEGEKSSVTLSKDAIISVPGEDEKKLLASFDAFMNNENNFPFSSPNTKTLVKDATNLQGYIPFNSPIPYLTPLATSVELPTSKIINIEYLTPIQLE